MKTLYEVSYYDYDEGKVYGIFESDILAKELLEEVQKYYNSIDDKKDVGIRSYHVFDQNDIIYRHKTTLCLQTNSVIDNQAIAPTYAPGVTNIDLLISQINEGHGIRYVIGYGINEEESLVQAKNIYQKLEEQDLIKKVIEQIKLFDKKYSY